MKLAKIFKIPFVRGRDTRAFSFKLTFGFTPDKGTKVFSNIKREKSTLSVILKW